MPHHSAATVLHGHRTLVDPEELDEFGRYLSYVYRRETSSDGGYDPPEPSDDKEPLRPPLLSSDAIPPRLPYTITQSLAAQLKQDHNTFHAGQDLTHPTCPLCETRRLRDKIRTMGRTAKKLALGSCPLSVEFKGCKISLGLFLSDAETHLAFAFAMDLLGEVEARRNLAVSVSNLRKVIAAQRQEDILSNVVYHLNSYLNKSD